MQHNRCAQCARGHVILAAPGAKCRACTEIEAWMCAEPHKRCGGSGAMECVVADAQSSGTGVAASQGRGTRVCHYRSLA